MKVIFLDVDGVLITDETRRLGNRNVSPACVAALNSLLERTDARIVLSTSWRVGLTGRELCALFRQWGVTGGIIDKTPNLPEGCRGDEIARWLEERQTSRGDVESFVIIDDHDDMGELMPYLVRTRSAVGFSDEDVERATEILSKPVRALVDTEPQTMAAE